MSKLGGPILIICQTLNCIVTTILRTTVLRDFFFCRWRFDVWKTFWNAVDWSMTIYEMEKHATITNRKITSKWRWWLFWYVSLLYLLRYLCDEKKPFSLITKLVFFLMIWHNAKTTLIQTQGRGNGKSVYFDFVTMTNNTTIVNMVMICLSN